MTKLDAGLITSLPASDPGSAAVWGSKRINPRPQFCLCLAWSGCPSNDDDGVPRTFKWGTIQPKSSMLNGKFFPVVAKEEKSSLL